MRGIAYLLRRGMRVVTWNCNGLFLHPGAAADRRIAKMKLLSALLDSSDFLALQETHGSPEDLAELQKHVPFHVLYGSFCENRGMGGVVAAVRRTLLSRCTTAVTRPLYSGRVLQVLLDGPSLCFNLVCVHLDTALPQQQIHTILLRIFSTRDVSYERISILAGDFNLTYPGDSRLRLSDARLLPPEDTLGAWFAEHCALQGHRL